MDSNFFEEQFKAVISEIPRQDFDDSGLKLSVDLVLNSIALKIYKPEWSNDIKSPLHSKIRIFFSIWVNDKTIKEEKIYYNIHALKLRELKDYKISSRDFAEKFRDKFAEYQEEWKNVSIDFGPLTLMEGWIKFNEKTLENDIIDLSQKFLKISFLIDKCLEFYRSK